MPPISAAVSVQMTSRGMEMARASTFGMIRRKPCEMPITSMASSSSVTRMTPSWAVMDEPERPATRMAANKGPSSRMTLMPSRLTR
ncbi:hypothetical protein D3C72_1298040 [compost metagenome]